MLKIRSNLRNVATMVACLAVTTMFSGCNDEEKQPEIKVENSTTLSQTVYADETNGKSGVTIVTKGAWSSSITEGAVKSTKAGTTTWLSINPNSGSAAGQYTIVISLEPNATGEDRTATIMIACNGEEIRITVTQKGIKENGELYEPNPGWFKTVPFDGKITAQVVNGNAYNSVFSTVKATVWYDEAIPVDKPNRTEYYGSKHIATGVYANGGFTITLPATPDNSFLKRWADLGADGFGWETQFSNPDVKVVFIDFIDAYNTAGNPVDYFLFLNYEGGGVSANYIYVDRDVTVSDPIIDNGMALKKGWNIIYWSGTVTQTVIDGMKWYTNSYLED